jgi:hypothetical protein
MQEMNTYMKYNNETGFVSDQEIDDLLNFSAGSDINPASTPSSWPCVLSVTSIISAVTAMDSCPTGAVTKAC